MPRRCLKQTRRVLPVWLVLASLALGLLATAASVDEASYRYARWQFVLGFQPVAWSAEIDHGDRFESVMCFAERGVECWHWDPGPFAPYPRELTQAMADHMWSGPMPVDIGPEDDPRPAMARVPDPGYETNPLYLRAGWPLFAAQGREIYGFPTGTSVGRTHELIGLMPVKIGRRYVDIPYRPIWPGVLGNLLFYTTPALVLLASMRLGLLALRRRRRRRRGKCIGCGYEPGEGITNCPECGRSATPLLT